MPATRAIDGERHRDQEGPAPADAGQQSAQDQPGRVAAGAEDGEDRQGPVAGRPFVERGGEDGQRGRRGERGGEALDEAGDDQQRAVVDEAADQRGDGEDGERDQEDPAAAEQVGGTAAEQQQTAVAEHVAVDDPLQRGGRQAQFGTDGRQRHAHHRHVETVEEHHDAQHREDAPEARGPALVGPGRRRLRRGAGTGGVSVIVTARNARCTCIECPRT